MTDTDGGDPRLALEGFDLAMPDAEGRPLVARPPQRPNTPAIAAVFTVAGVGLFLALNAARTSTAEASTLTAPTAGALPSAPELALPISGQKVSAAPLPVPPPPVARPAPVLAAVTSPMVTAPPQIDPLARRKAPAVVVDLSPAPRPSSGMPNAAMTGMQIQSGPAAAAPSAGLPAAALDQAPVNPAEAFAARLSGGAEAAVATPMRNPGLVVPQGAVIPAVLETAINSDLPGYTRAVVSRDVRSFDGRTVLIPRGSRLIGQYKSAVSLGQSRAFVIWTRVTRPDGVSVDIGSPAADELGRAGLEGDVERHFFERYGGSILLSVLNGIVASIGGSPATTISIGSPLQAANTAASAQSDTVSPTVKVPQGEAIRIFVARDLDFSLVGAMP